MFPLEKLHTYEERNMSSKHSTHCIIPFSVDPISLLAGSNPHLSFDLSLQCQKVSGYFRLGTEKTQVL